METTHRSNVAAALVLILCGVVLLAVQFVPVLNRYFLGDLGWPLIVVAVGAGLLVIGLATGAYEMAVPACIVGGIGGLLCWQNATGYWASWAYVWTLIPGFVGVGGILAGLLRGRWRDALDGLWSVFVSLVLFAVFASFLGGWGVFGPYWPVLIIVLGLILLGRSVVGAFLAPAKQE